MTIDNYEYLIIAFFILIGFGLGTIILDTMAESRRSFERKRPAGIKRTISSTRKNTRWAVKFNRLWSGSGYYECPECKYKFSIGAYLDLDDYGFCPYCGADLRVDENE